MTERFLKFIPSDEAFWLMHSKPNAFRLLAHIANTARRYNGHPDGLKIGQCHLKHWSKYGLTESEYRTAKTQLCKGNFIKIIETNRTRQKLTTEMTTEMTTLSTLVELLDSRVWDINAETIDDRNDDRNDDRIATESRQTRKKKKEKIISISDDIENIAQTASQLRKKDSLTFNASSFCYEGITDDDLKSWKEVYPNIDLKTEMLRSIEWLRSNPSKSRKKNWRSFVNNWFKNADNWSENKKAGQAARSGQNFDKKTKNMDGTPIASAAENLF